MNFRRQIICYLVLLWVIQAQAQAVSFYPEAGRPCPKFKLHNISYYSRRTATLEDFKGKWLVLSFWNKSCGACVAGFPYENKMQKVLGNKIQVMLVGIQDKEGKIEGMYSRFSKAENLDLPCSFDSVQANKWDIYTAPYIVVIDPYGLVKAVTYSLSIEDMLRLINGKAIQCRRAYRMHENEVDDKILFDPKKPFLLSENGGADSNFLFRSMLTNFDDFRQQYYFPASISDALTTGSFQILGASLERLYDYAYLGKTFPDSGYSVDALWEIGDSVLKGPPLEYREELFCYSLIVPPDKRKRGEIENIMRRDLLSYFGFRAEVEERGFEGWKLVTIKANTAELLVSKGGVSHRESIIPKADFKLINYPVAKLVDILSDYNVIDGTGIKGNIDIEMDCILSNFSEVKATLAKNGLGLQPIEVKKKVLVIKKE